MTEAAATNASARDQLRGKIFAQKVRSQLVKAFDTDIEVRQPTLDRALAQSTESTSNLDATVDMLIQCCYLPGTNTPVFDIADRDGLKQLPLGSDLTKLMKVISELTGGSIELQAKKSEPTPSAITS